VQHDVLITIEEGAVGGFGDHVNHFLTNSVEPRKTRNLDPRTLHSAPYTFTST
jgi:deoxyxylulose-5-phosphate synthase